MAKTIFSLILSSIFFYSFSQNTCTSNGTGGGEWGNAATWSCTGGATFPDLTVSTVNILVGDNVTITNSIEGGFNYVFFTPQDTLNTIIYLDGDLTFDGLGAQLMLAKGSSIVFGESGNLVSNGALVDVLTIGDNNVWNGQADGDVSGPGVMDETSTNGSLPIELASFDVHTIERKIEVMWTTTSEFNNDFFSIQRSEDGIVYEDIAQITGSGFTTKPVNYSWIDDDPLFGRSYYRLKQTDFDGTSEIFEPIAVEATSLMDGKLTIASNPVNKGDKVRIITSANNDEVLTITISDMLGNMILNDQFARAEYEFHLNEYIDSGIYYVTVSSINSIETARLVVN